MYDYLIVGAGLFGAVFAREAAAAGKRCLVIDKRSHIAGNIYTEDVEGIAVHRYGAHIFHTNNKAVWDYVNRFATFNRYTNSPVANYKGELYNLPFNMNTFNKMWGVVTPAEAQAKIDEIWQQISDPLTLYRQAVAMTEAWEAVRVESEITLTDAWEDQQTQTVTTSSQWYIDADNWVTVSQQDGQQTSLVCREGTAYLVTPAGSMETTADGSLWGEYSLEDMEFVRQDVNDSLQYVVMQVPADKLQADWESQPTVQQMTEEQRAGLPRPVARQYTFHLNKVGQLSERDETIDFEYEKQLEGGGTAAATQRQQTTSSYTVIAAEDAQAKIDQIWQQATGG